MDCLALLADKTKESETTTTAKLATAKLCMLIDSPGFA